MLATQRVQLSCLTSASQCLPTLECAFPRFCFSFVRRTKAQDRLHCRVQPSPFHVRMRFSTFLLFVLSFVRKSAGQAALQGARHEVLHQILWSDTSGSHWQFSVGHCPRMSAHGWKLWKRCRVFRAPRMANSSWFSLRQLQNGFAVCTNVQRACFPLRCFPFVRRTAVDINVYEELRDVRCGIAFFCVHTSIRRCKATAGLDNRGRSTCCFASFARETRPGFLGLLRTLPDVPFLTFFESLSHIELAVLACTVIVVRKFKHISPRMSIALSPSLQ